MAYPYPPIPSPQAERTEQLARLIYELLDAHTDTELLVQEPRNELHWRAHLSYLRDLQRAGRAILAEEIDTAQYSLGLSGSIRKASNSRDGITPVHRGPSPT